MQRYPEQSPPTPRKPPRGKYTRETYSSSSSNLLMSVIKTLDASENNEEREREKLKIEKEFKKSDKKLQELVGKHDSELTKTMQLFTKISSEVDFSRDKVHTVRENLQTCKHLLRCRREELKKLYMDAVKNKHVMQYLDHINELRTVNSTKFTANLKKRHYLKATKMLMSSIEIAEGQLRHVEGLDDLRRDFTNKKVHLYTKLIEEMNKHIYHCSTTEVLTNFQRNNSTRISSNQVQPFQRTVVRKSADRIEANNKAKKALLEISQNGFVVEDLEIIDDTTLLDPEINSTYFIGIIVECFALLNKVPESVETMKVQMQFELLAIVEKTTQYIIDLRNRANGKIILENGEIDVPFLELLDLLFKQFQLIAEAHKLTLKNYSSIIKRYQVNVKSYDLTDFWGQVQAVLQLLLTDYLDIQNTGDDELRMNFPEQQVNINSFFSRRKVVGKKTLFRFDKSSHTTDIVSSNTLEVPSRGHLRNLSNVSNSSATKDILTSISGKKRREKLFVCKPDPSLIRKIFIPMLAYIHTIESNANMKKNGQVSSLNDFMTTYVKESYLSRGHNRNLLMTIESLSKSQDAWKAIISPEEMKKLSVQRPLLQSCRVVENLIAETKQLIEDLPSYHDDLLKNVCSLLKTYRETCQAAYRGIVQPETEDKRIYSVAWLKDEDISRFLKTLPNYLDLKTANAKAKRGKLKTEMSEEDSPTQIQQRNIREAEMLTSNLGDGGISHSEILSDIGVLKELAILQESMEWFAYRINEFASNLKKPINFVSKSGHTTLPAELVQPIVIKDGMIKVLTNLALEFDELANICLLVLHLEVRVQCFHYLRSNSSDKFKDNNPNKNDTLEPDTKVLKLTKVLSDLDEAFSSTLHPRKTKYIFEGLAHLVARILIMASNSMESLENHAIQQMIRNSLALQQTLSSITATREHQLDHARHYYEMLYKEPEDIIKDITEKGPKYTELQYLQAFKLICQGRTNENGENFLTIYQQKLNNILGTKQSLGITV